MMIPFWTEVFNVNAVVACFLSQSRINNRWVMLKTDVADSDCSCVSIIKKLILKYIYLPD